MPRTTPSPSRCGPSWVGIGAQRSGTTWFTRLATSHPAVTLGRGGRKELHYFDRFLIDPFDDAAAETYCSMFAWPGGGEFTPAYLRSPWVPGMLLEACGEPPLVVAMLRDPIARLESSVRWRLRWDGWADSSAAQRSVDAVAFWESAVQGSSYGSQLAHWRDHVGAENMLVVQYEAVRRDPEALLHAFWARLGFGPVPLRGVDTPSSTSTDGGWRLPAALRGPLVEVLGPEVERTLGEWSLDRALWHRWGDAAAGG